MRTKIVREWRTKLDLFRFVNLNILVIKTLVLTSYIFSAWKTAHYKMYTYILFIDLKEITTQVLMFILYFLRIYLTKEIIVKSILNVKKSCMLHFSSKKKQQRKHGRFELIFFIKLIFLFKFCNLVRTFTHKHFLFSHNYKKS